VALFARVADVRNTGVGHGVVAAVRAIGHHAHRARRGAGNLGVRDLRRARLLGVGWEIEQQTGRQHHEKDGGDHRRRENPHLEFGRGKVKTRRRVLRYILAERLEGGHFFISTERVNEQPRLYYPHTFRTSRPPRQYRAFPTPACPVS